MSSRSTCGAPRRPPSRTRCWIIRPAPDAALALGMMHVLIAEDLCDRSSSRAHHGLRRPRGARARHSARVGGRGHRSDEAVIEGLARRYAATRPAMILLGAAACTRAPTLAGRAGGGVPAALTGNTGIAGGGLGPRHGSKGHGFGLTEIALPRGGAGDYVPNQMPRITEALENGGCARCSSSATTCCRRSPDTARLEAALGQELHRRLRALRNDTARRFADVVLPGNRVAGGARLKATNTHLNLMEARCRPPADAYRRWVLARARAASRVADFYPWADSRDHRRDPRSPRTGHATVATLRAEGGIRALRVSHVGHPDLVFPHAVGEGGALIGARGAFACRAAVHEDLPARALPLVLRQGTDPRALHGFYDPARASVAGRATSPSRCCGSRPPTRPARRVADGAAVRVFNERGEMRPAQLGDGPRARAHRVDARRLGRPQSAHFREACIPTRRWTCSGSRRARPVRPAVAGRAV